MTRLPDWEPRLAAWLRTHTAMPHAYGRHDCMIGLAAGVIKAVTGVDPARGHRGKYGSARSAAAYLKRAFDVDEPAALLDRLLAPCPIAKARRGDLVADAGGIPGVCLGARAAFIGMDGARSGLVTLPRRHWSRAWRVG